LLLVREGLLMPEAGGNASTSTAAMAAADNAEKENKGLMAWLRNLTLKSKLLLMLLPIGLLSMGVQAVLGHINSSQSMAEQGFAKAIAIRQSKKQQLEAFYANLRAMMPVIGEDVAVVSATAQMKEAFGQLGRTRITDQRRQSLETYYRSSFVPSLAQKMPPDQQVLFENIWPRTDRSIEAQVLFIAENRFQGAERQKLVDHPISNPYTLAHFTYHARFLEIMQRLKLYDLMVIDPDTGNMIYSVAKEVDFATSLLDGPYSNTNMGRLVRRVIAEHKRGFVALSDFETYLPSGFVPAQFIATPIYANFRLVGILIGQVSSGALNDTLNGQNSWVEDGLGTTGAVYIVGADRTLRSDHRPYLENRDAFLTAMKARGVSDQVVERVRRAGTTIATLPVSLESADRAQRGETGTIATRGIRGQPTLQAYAPLDVPDVTWSLVTQLDRDEVLSSVNAMQRNMMILACTLALGTVLLSMLLAGRFLRPVTRLLGGMADLQTGKEVAKLEQTSTDEFGQLTGHFNRLTDQLRARDMKIAEKTESNGLLLRRLFPASIVDRMVKGETQIVDLVSNVTVVYASVIGFAKATEDKTPAESMALLNEIFDVFDAQAGEHGIDRVKTIGEHYIAACGLSEIRLDHAQRAVAFSDGAARELRRLAEQKGLRLDMRAALASGDINAGLVGDRRFVFEIWGKPLNFSRRLVHEAATGEIRITEATHKLLGVDAEFSERPTVEGRTLGPIQNFGRHLGEPRVKLSQAAE
jgi:class 3 adenylate cyclase